MTHDERRNKIQAENLFYLELHQHGGNFEAMLTPDELAIWNEFPEQHKQLFMRWRDWEWMAKTSLQKSLMQERAWARLNSYRKLAASCKKYMPLHELIDFLFPLIDVKGSFLKQEAMQAICEGTEDPEKLRIMDSIEWEDYSAPTYGVNIKWLEKQDSEYLRECATVWRVYLPAENMQPIEQPPVAEQEHQVITKKEKKRLERVKAYEDVCNDPLYAHLGEEKKRDIAGGKVNPKVGGLTIWRALRGDQD